MEIFRKIIHIIIIMFLFFGWFLYLCIVKPKLSIIVKNIFEKFKRNWQSILWIVIYITLVALSTSFVVCNWPKCLEMEFFSRFNGYNIIWILWIFLLFMPLISVDNKWFKIANPLSKKEKEMENIEQNTKTEQLATQFESLAEENELKKEHK